jgi:hypothetical protein
VQKNIKLLLVAGVVVVTSVFFVWLVTPRPGQLTKLTCEPSGLVASVSASLHGRRFWEAQLRDITRQRLEAENWDLAHGRITRHAVEFSQKSMEEIDLPKTAEQRLVESLRARADLIEADREDRELSAAMKSIAARHRECEAKIRKRL